MPWLTLVGGLRLDHVQRIGDDWTRGRLQSFRRRRMTPLSCYMPDLSEPRTFTNSALFLAGLKTRPNWNFGRRSAIRMKRTMTANLSLDGERA